MTKQNLSAISPKEIESTVKALKKLRDQMPFLVALSPLERSHSSHVNVRTLQAAQISLSAVREYPSIVPAGFDLDQFERTVRAAAELGQCQTALKALLSDVQDTLLAVGAEALKGTQLVRAVVKASAKTTPGLKQIAESLAIRPERRVVAEATAPVLAPEADAAAAPAPSPGPAPQPLPPPPPAQMQQQPPLPAPPAPTETKAA